MGDRQPSAWRRAVPGSGESRQSSAAGGQLSIKDAGMDALLLFECVPLATHWQPMNSAICARIICHRRVPRTRTSR